MVKAIALLSGGLDSTLAARLIIEQGIELEAVNFLTVFAIVRIMGKVVLPANLRLIARGLNSRSSKSAKNILI